MANNGSSFSGPLFIESTSGAKVQAFDADGKATLNYSSATDGTTVLAASILEINRVADVSGRLVAAGATLSATEALHDGKIIALDTAAGSVVTLPASSGSGATFRFIVSVKATSNAHIIKVANTTDVLSGSVNILDNDGAAQGGYAATGTDDTITLNGTTTGGLVGDWVEVVDVLAGFWAIRGQLVVPAGSDPADVFSATVSA